MQQTVSALLRARGISLCAPISLRDCRITRPYLLERAGIGGEGTAFLLAVPYYTTKCADPARNISNYAVSADYHGFFSALFAETLPVLREKFPQNRFAGFADHSPIAEVEAAAAAGLGLLGRHHLLITAPYASFVFLGEIVTDASLDVTVGPPRPCEGCGACDRACPAAGGECLSALTQKKGALTAAEQQAILSHGCAWGCDACQTACPHTVRALAAGSIYTEIPFFTETALPHLDVATLQTMSDEALASRAYGWRGRQTILRNLMLLEKGDVT